ncbi:Tab2/Atab2 family RNA-binding protein [Anabaena sp. FACHB-1237]|uniref:Tab2/Atab2 family RNA-binding protein n=1 Tax=Anabaena sp. FACHB-1237 TaxID=2692769 RepID=UPI00168129B3|nr:Tab2/Atab2 family RNA-binding protein [Anabaena sp. FACHB-1237]MBD2139096.1 Tab2/Atab2 family RNA-binding protein [Anabaena sp. FACHB-1237]
MGSIWELDFYSRPILDENQKKVWEVLVCESPVDTTTKTDTLFRYAKYCPSTEVNSGWLRTALQEAISQSGSPPIKIRFFRRQMNNMITKACEGVGIPALPSRKTLVLNQWIKQRMEEVYPQEQGYQGGSSASVRLDRPLPQRLPDALEGKQWAFVTLTVADLAEMPEWEIGFGEAFPLDLVKLAPETKIPGILIFSPRALPIAGWMSGLELAYLRFDTTQGDRLILETGATESWIVANIRSSELLLQAKGFDIAKQEAKGVHFIGVQSDPQSQTFAGFWLLQEISL